MKRWIKGPPKEPEKKYYIFGWLNQQYVCGAIWDGLKFWHDGGSIDCSSPDLHHMDMPEPPEAERPATTPK